MSGQFGGRGMGKIDTGMVAISVLKNSYCPTAPVNVGLPGTS